jgi:histone H3/H4
MRLCDDVCVAQILLELACQVREVAQDFYTNDPLRWQAMAIQALQEVPLYYHPL